MTAELEERQVVALERIATALEQMALDREVAPPPAPNGTQPLPPLAPAPFTFTPVTMCPVHHVPWKTVPAGVSKRTGNAYSAFSACPERDCNQRPPA